MGPPTGARDDCEFPEVFHPDATSPRNESVQWLVRADQGLGVPNGTAGDTMTSGGEGSVAPSVMEQSPEAHGDVIWSAVRAGLDVEGRHGVPSDHWGGMEMAHDTRLL
jgi:hypothetical protein